MSAPRAVRAHRSAGFTLVEILVTVAILGVVFLVASRMLVGSNRMQQATVQRADAQAMSRQTLSLMCAEIRQAGADPSQPPVGITAIVTGDSTRLRVRADLDGNGAITTAEPSEDVTYAWVDSTQTITRDPGAGASAVLAGVTDMRFRYFNSANTEFTTLPLSSSDAALVRSVLLTFTTNDGRTPPLTLTTRITLRNH